MPDLPDDELPDDPEVEMEAADVLAGEAKRVADGREHLAPASTRAKPDAYVTIPPPEHH